jgi:hypothetical protein
MRVEVTAHGAINDQACTYAEYRVFAALAQAPADARRTRVILRSHDASDCRDAVTCSIAVHFDRAGMLRIRAAGAHPYEAINRAVDRLSGATAGLSEREPVSR